MKFTIVTPYFLILAGIIVCNGNRANEKMFGFLRSAEKCTKEADPAQCVKRNLNDWCEKREDSLKDGTTIAKVCECIDGNTPLNIAVCAGHFDIIKLLVDHGANIKDIPGLEKVIPFL